MHHRRIVKQGPVVLATNENGTMDPSSASSQGLFLSDTRFLSTFKVHLNDQEPLLLGSTEEILFQASYLQTNRELTDIPARGIGVLQRNCIDQGTVRIEFTIANWALKDIEFDLSIEIDSDFFDSFEARGVKRLQRGETKEPRVTSDSVELQYVGLDRVTRTTRVEVTPAMDRFVDHCMHFPVKLQDAERLTVELKVTMTEDVPEGVPKEPRPVVGGPPKPAWFDESSRITTNNTRVEAVIQRSLDDLEVLIMEWWDLWVPAAGLPRFAVPFGRDCVITSLETLVWNPRMAHDVLYFLARTQGKEENAWNYEQPGKIMHELHTGELARLNAIPFGRFYGSVDSTPLFLILGAEYIRWTGDMRLYHDLAPHFDAAWDWIDNYSHINDDTYIQYEAHTPPRASSAALTVGLFNQGWKDSSVAVMYSDGTMVTDHPISLAEVQGELYRALQMWSDLFLAMPESENVRERGLEFAKLAAHLKSKFNREFWMEDKGYYAMALDGHHRHVDSITSNPAECLWTRLIDEEHADAFVKTLMGDGMMTNWGIRTMASTEKAYNPFSYHDGSIWPFENALIAAGLKKYGYVHETQAIFDAMIDASLYFEYRRWPEVYCGVSKSVGGVLAQQPDASRPQAWSAGAMFLLLQTILGIAPRPFTTTVDITPALPSCLDEVVARGIRIAGGCLSMRLLRQDGGILMEIMDNPDDLDILIHPATRHHHASEAGPAISG